MGFDDVARFHQESPYLFGTIFGKNSVGRASAEKRMKILSNLPNTFKATICSNLDYLVSKREGEAPNIGTLQVVLPCATNRLLKGVFEVYSCR